MKPGAISAVAELVPRRYRQDNFDWNGVVLRDPCSYCGRMLPCSRDSRNAAHRRDPRRWQSVEHVTPLNRGGSNRWDNKVSACYWCNVQRSDEPLLGYLLRRFAQTQAAPPNVVAPELV